jgi:transposase-like protein
LERFWRFFISQAIQKTFVLKEKSNTREYGVTHNQVNASNGEGFNIKIERLHNSVRHRIKTFRGFHGSTESANTLMKGYEIYYNFIRKHLALGKTPSELATDIKLENSNGWSELINLSMT